MNLREQILNTKDIRSETVHIPEWGVDVLVSSMSVAERGKMVEMRAASNAASDGGTLDALMCIYCARDPKTGERIFEIADQDALLSKNSKPVSRINELALRLSGLTPEATAELEKNSEPRSEEPSSDSPVS